MKKFLKDLLRDKPIPQEINFERDTVPFEMRLENSRKKISKTAKKAVFEIKSSFRYRDEKRIPVAEWLREHGLRGPVGCGVDREIAARCGNFEPAIELVRNQISPRKSGFGISATSWQRFKKEFELDF